MKQLTKKPFSGPIAAGFAAAVCCVLWGSAYPAIKTGYLLFNIAQQDAASQILFAGIRFALAGVLAILIGSILQKKFLFPRKTALKPIFMLAGVQTIAQYLFFYIGLANASAVRSSIINGSSSFIAILIACFIFRQERFTRAKLLACLLGFASVIFMNTTVFSATESFALNGEGFILFSTIAYAFSSSMIKIFSQRENPVLLSGYQFMLGGIIMVVAGILLGGRLRVVSGAGLGVLLYLAAVSAIAYSLWGILLQKHPVSRIAIFGFMIPLFGVLLSGLFLNEADEIFSLNNLLALVCVCVGIIILNRKSDTLEANRLK